MRAILLLLVLFSSEFAFSVQCRTQVDVTKDPFWFWDWDIQSINVTVKNLKIRAVDGRIYSLKTPASAIDLRSMERPGNGFLINLVDDFPVRGEEMSYDYIDTTIQQRPQPVLKLASGEACKIVLLGGGQTYPESYCGVPGTYRMYRGYSGGILHRDYQLIYAENQVRHHFQHWEEIKTQNKECCPAGVAWGDSKCTKSSRELSREKICHLEFQCTNVKEIVGG